MKKKVNIYPTHPVTTVNPAIRTTTMRVIKPVEDIRKCIISRAIVDEILDDGSTVRLTLTNYDKDNSRSKIQKVMDDVRVEEDITKREEIVTDNDSDEEDSGETAAEDNKPNPQQNAYNNKFNNGGGKHNKHNKNKYQNNRPQPVVEKEESVETLDVESIDSDNTDK